MNWITATIAQFCLSQTVYFKRVGLAMSATVVPLGLGVALPWESRDKAPISGAPADAYILSGFIAFALFFGVYTLVNSMTSRRDALLYKRLRTTAMPDTSILAGEALSSTLPTVVVSTILTVFGVAVLGTGLPLNLPMLVVGILAGAAMFALLAVGLAGVLPKAETAMWVVTPIMVVFMVCSGIYLPLSALPGAIGEIAMWLPMSPVVSVVRTAYLGQDYATHAALLGSGGHPHLGFVQVLSACSVPLITIACWGGLGVVLARRLFRWDPRRAPSGFSRLGRLARKEMHA
ncbi:MAG: ABC transporter permease [Rhodococcus sp. (in: high G+C Gram-positive bacteria)]